MAIRWFSGEADAASEAALSARLDVIWKTLQRCTLPAKVHTLSGKPLKGFRMGQHMLEIIHRDGLYLQANGPFCLPD